MENNDIKVKTPKVKLTDDPEYFKKYYHSSTLSDKTQCVICNKVLSCQKMKRHQKSKYCMNIYNKKVMIHVEKGGLREI